MYLQSIGSPSAPDHRQPELGLHRPVLADSQEALHAGPFTPWFPTCATLLETHFSDSPFLVLILVETTDLQIEQ